MKKIAYITLALLLLLSLAACGGGDSDKPTDTPDASTPVVEQSIYTPEEAFEFVNGVITAYIGEYDVVRIPPEIGGVEVTTIGQGAFKANKVIAEVYLPDTVKTLEKEAFVMAENLQLLELGGVEAIGEEALRYTALTELIIPAAVKSIGDKGLSSSNIQRVVFASETLPDLGEGSLTHVKGPIVVPNSIDESKAPAVTAALNAAGLSFSVMVEHEDGSPLFIDYGDDFDFNQHDGTLRAYLGDDPVCHIPAAIGGVAVKQIGSSIFADAENIREVYIPEGVEIIGNSAFNGCTSIEIVVMPDSVTEVGKQVFFKTPNLKAVTWSKNADVPEYAFSYSGITAITIPDGVKSIGEYAFEHCESLSDITLGDSISVMGKNVFSSCYSIDVIDFLPASLKEIPPSAFFECMLVEEIHIPEGVTHIGDSAFTGCGDTKVNPVDYGVNYYWWGADPAAELGELWVQHEDLPRLLKIYLPSTIEYVGWTAFARTRIDAIFLPEGLLEVSQLPEFHEGAFKSMYYIGLIYLPEAASQAQVDAMDQFFLQFEDVGDRCWWYEGKHNYYISEWPE